MLLLLRLLCRHQSMFRLCDSCLRSSDDGRDTVRFMVSTSFVMAVFADRSRAEMFDQWKLSTRFVALPLISA